MLQGSTSFDQPLAWQTGSITNIKNMCSGASSFSQDLSSWSVSQLTREATQCAFCGTRMAAELTSGANTTNACLVHASWSAQMGAEWDPDFAFGVEGVDAMCSRPPSLPPQAPPRSPPPQATQWTPESLHPLAWYDASDYNSLVISNGSVSQWKEEGGSGLDMFQNDSISQPDYQADAFNNRPTLRFDGQTHVLFCYPLAAAVGNNDVTIFTAGRMPTNMDVNAVFFQMVGFDPATLWYIRSVNNQHQVLYGSSSLRTHTFSSTSGVQKFITAQRSNGNTVRTFFNGDLIRTDTTDFPSPF
jgi:hypothetical protein